jgi:hypothetical protein
MDILLNHRYSINYSDPKRRAQHVVVLGLSEESKWKGKKAIVTRVTPDGRRIGEQFEVSPNDLIAPVQRKL